MNRTVVVRFNNGERRTFTGSDARFSPRGEQPGEPVVVAIWHGEAGPTSCAGVFAASTIKYVCYEEDEPA